MPNNNTSGRGNGVPSRSTAASAEEPSNLSREGSRINRPRDGIADLRYHEQPQGGQQSNRHSAVVSVAQALEEYRTYTEAIHPPDQHRPSRTGDSTTRVPGSPADTSGDAVPLRSRSKRQSWKQSWRNSAVLSSPEEFDEEPTQTHPGIESAPQIPEYSPGVSDDALLRRSGSKRRSWQQSWRNSAVLSSPEEPDQQPNQVNHGDEIVLHATERSEDIPGNNLPSRSGSKRQSRRRSQRNSAVLSSPSELEEQPGRLSEMHEMPERNAAGEEPAADPNLVTWDGPKDPYNPKNWSFGAKWMAVTITSLITLISTVSSSMIAPALTSMDKDLHFRSSVEEEMSLSIFLLAFAIGPLIIGPLSELYGRIIVLQLSNLVFLAFNIGCGFVNTSGQLIALRFFSGLGGSAPLALGSGILSDCFTPDQRGIAIMIYSLAPLLGPAIGPITGGFITENTTWRWCFHAVSIADGALLLLGFGSVHESYGPVLLRRKKQRLVSETGNPNLHTMYDKPDNTVAGTFRNAMVRPFRLLLTQPIIQVLALYMMFLYGIMYLVLSSFPTLWEAYGMSVSSGSLNYIALGLGFLVGAQICAPTTQIVYHALKRKHGLSEGKPEFRVPMMVLGSLLVPVGLIIYGWTAQNRTHWIGPDAGGFLYTAGTIFCFQCIQSYLVDAYPLYAASAVGAATFLRSCAGFAFPLFAPSLYKTLDFGWGNTLLALLAVGIGWPSPILLWTYGEKLRKRSQYAAGGEF